MGENYQSSGGRFDIRGHENYQSSGGRFDIRGQGG